MSLMGLTDADEVLFCFFISHEIVSYRAVWRVASFLDFFSRLFFASNAFISYS